MSNHGYSNVVHIKQFNKILSILTSLRTRDNSDYLRSLEQLIVDLCHEKQTDQNQQCPYYFDLVEIDKEVQRLQLILQDIVVQNSDKMILRFEKHFGSLANKISNLAPTTMHMYSTRMKKHLIDEIKLERGMRMRAETQLVEVLEVIEQRQGIKQAKKKQHKDCRRCEMKNMQIEGLVQSIKKLDSMIDNQRSANENLRHRIERERKQNKALHSPRIMQQEKQIDRLEKQNQSLKRDIDHLNRTIMSLNGKLADTKSQISKIGRQVEAQEKYQIAAHRLQSENHQLKQNFNSMKIKIQSLETSNKMIEQKNKNLQKQLKQKQRDMSNMIESYQRKNQMSENSPSRVTYDLISQKMYGTSSSSAFKPRDMNLQISSPLQRSRRGRDDSVMENEELLRMLMIQASSLEKFLI